MDGVGVAAVGGGGMAVGCSVGVALGVNKGDGDDVGVCEAVGVAVGVCVGGGNLVGVNVGVAVTALAFSVGGRAGVSVWLAGSEPCATAGN